MLSYSIRRPNAGILRQNPSDASERDSETAATDVPPLFAAVDIVQVVRLLVVGLFAWLTPSRLWPAVATSLAGINRRLRPDEVARMTEHIAVGLGEQAPKPASEIAMEGLTAAYEERLQLLRDHRPDRWRPETRIENAERIDAALSQGKGVILWVASFVFSSHITKMSLKRAGYDVTHLSRPTHGFSKSRFGIRFINPIQTRIEERYVAERIVITESEPIGALRVLLGRLRANGIVSITLSNEAARLLPIPFLDGMAHIPTGPAEFARMTGATILPVCTLRDDRWCYSTHIGAPIAAPGLRGADHDEAIARAYACWLEPIVRDNPAHWKSWSLVTARDSAG